MKQVCCTLLWLCLAVPSFANELRVATVQFESKDGAYQTNLDTASRLIRSAREQGAQLVLLPEFALIGYELSANLWANAETLNGRTASDLAVLARETQLYIATTLLEVEGEHFYNTFVMISPEGSVVGTVRKRKPAGAEGYFFRGADGPHVIGTPLGQIGVGICQENYRCFLPAQLHQAGADLVLMPFSYPDLSASGGLASPTGTYIGSWYAAQLGIPVITSNKTGLWPQVEGSYFPGASAVVAADGTVLGTLDNEPGVLVVDVRLDSKLKSAPSGDCIGPYLKGLTLGSWFEKRITWTTIWLMGLFNADPDDAIAQTYQDNESRRSAARKLTQTN